MINLNESIKGKPPWTKALIIALGLIVPIVMLVTAVVVAIWVVEIFTCGLSETYELNAPYFRCLPSDQEMIAHFQRHRADFERLVRLYREDSSVPTRSIFVQPTPEIQAIMQRARVNAIRCDAIVWMLPDPYSEHAREKTKRLGLNRKATYGNPEVRKFNGVILGYDHAKVRRLDSNLSEVHKGYYYTPFPPIIEKRTLRTPFSGYALSSSLDSYPCELVMGNCVYRQFEPQWFLELCQ